MADAESIPYADFQKEWKKEILLIHATEVRTLDFFELGELSTKEQLQYLKEVAESKVQVYLKVVIVYNDYHDMDKEILYRVLDFAIKEREGITVNKRDYQMFNKYYRHDDDAVITNTSIVFRGKRRKVFSDCYKSKYRRAFHFLNSQCEFALGQLANLHISLGKKLALSFNSIAMLYYYLGLVYNVAESQIKYDNIKMPAGPPLENSESNDDPFALGLRSLYERHLKHDNDIEGYFHGMAVFWCNYRRDSIHLLIEDSTAFSDFLVSLFAGGWQALIEGKIANFCRYCDDLFIYKRNKKYCSPLPQYEGKNCAKAARNRRFYKAHPEIKEKSRERVRLDREFYRIHGINPTEKQK